MGFFVNLLSFFGVTVEQEIDCQTDMGRVTQAPTPQTSHVAESQETISRQVPVDITQPVQKVPVETVQSVTPVRPVLIKEPDDLGTPSLPRPEDVPWLDDSQKVNAVIKVLNFGGESTHYWHKYYIAKKSVEEIVFEQKQDDYDYFWCRVRDCWKQLRQPFWKAYVAGHFPDPQAVKGNPELAREICVLDAEELKSRQVKSLIKDGVYVLGTLQNCLFSSIWRPMDLNNRDKWYFRKILTQYGLEVPPSDEPDPIPFEELYTGAVFGFDVTPEKRLSSYDFIQGDEPLEDRVRRVKDLWCFDNRIDAYEDVVFFLRSNRHEKYAAENAVDEARRSVKARKILAGGNYPEVRSAVVEGVDLDELEKIRVEDLAMSARAIEVIQKLLLWYFGYYDDCTLADVVRTYYRGWLLYERGAAAAEAREYLYRYNYVVRPEDMPIDERTPIAYLGLPIRIWSSLRRYESFETADDLVRCFSNDDPVFFPLRNVEGIGRRSVEIIRARLVGLGLLRDSQ